MTPTEKAKQEILEELAKKKIIARNTEEFLDLVKSASHKEQFIFDEVGIIRSSLIDNFIKSKILNDAIDLSFQKAHDLARQEFEKERKAIIDACESIPVSELVEDYYNNKIPGWLRTLMKEECKKERLSFAQKLEELKEEIEKRNMGKLHLESIYRMIDSLFKLKPEDVRK